MENFYKGFDLISSSDIPDVNGKAIYLYHRKTGLEVFHILNNDEENLFSFNFMTPIDNSMGCAHIMEHSVLCGSEKFPLKEPFTNLCNQSLNTFLNAMTGLDKTMYPASSLNATDYFNLMDVYGDAVFFPLLSENTFAQEAHRLEVDDEGNYSLQGVVYNEMKGCYSSLGRYTHLVLRKTMFPESYLGNDSGGDPLCINDFTYSQFREFHTKYYSPSNCLLFLYGNIPTEKQLDFIQEKLLDRLEKKYPEPDVPEKFPFISKDVLALRKITPVSEMQYIETIGPDSETKKSSACVAWKFSTPEIDSIYEINFLFTLLFGNDSSPIKKALLDSGLGQVPLFTGYISYESFLSIGLTEVEKENTQKIKDLVLSIVNRIAEEEIPQDDIDAAILQLDFSTREIVRSGGPFSLVLMDRALNGWVRGFSPETVLHTREAYKKLFEKIRKDKTFINSLIKKYITENKQSAFVVINPESSFLEERNKAEEEIIARLKENIDPVELKKQNDTLHEYQNHKETEEEVSCIPHISPKDLDPHANTYDVEVKQIKANNGSDIQLFLNHEDTNGIIYFDLLLPLDVLPLEDYRLLYLFENCTLNTGWNKKSWDKAIKEASLQSGDFYNDIIYAAPGLGKEAEEFFEKEKDKNYTNRIFLTLSMKFTSEKAEDALKIFSEAYRFMDFNDAERISLLLDQNFKGKKASILNSGSWYAGTRAACTSSRSDALDEIIRGISQLYTLKELKEKDPSEIGKKFQSCYETIKKNGAIIHVTADSESMKEVNRLLPDFVKETDIHSLSPAPSYTDEQIFELTKLPGQNTFEKEEYFTIPTQVGYAASCFTFNTFDGRDSADSTVLSHWLNSTLLWEKIRTAGGAYGANAGTNGLTKNFHISTYRDPTPVKSLSTFEECISIAAETNLSAEDLSRAITGSYSSQKQPYSPETRGFIGFKNYIYGILKEECDSFVSKILTVDPEGICNAAKKIMAAEKTKRSAVICSPETQTTSGVKIQLPE